MNPNVGEPVNPSGVSDKPISVPPPATTPDISRVENLVAAAQQEAAAVQAAGTLPGQAPVEGPKKDFENQFGSGVGTPPPASEPAPDLMAAALEGLGTQTPPAENPSSTDVKLDPNINTVDDLLREGPKAVADSTSQAEAEAVVLSEQTPAQKWEKLSDSVKAFLEEVTKEKVAA